MNKLNKVSLLILDDLGLKSYTLEESRYNKTSTILSGQIPHMHWYDLFPDPALADAIMDRIIHNAYILAGLKKIYAGGDGKKDHLGNLMSDRSKGCLLPHLKI